MMKKIENEKQYEWAVARVEELLLLVHDDTPEDDPLMIELKRLGDMVADYEEIHYPIG